MLNHMYTVCMMILLPWIWNTSSSFAFMIMMLSKGRMKTWFCKQHKKGCWWKTVLQTKNLIQEKCHQEGIKLQLTGWVFCGICADKAAVGVSAIRVEFYKANTGCRYIISDPRLELRHPGIDFRDVGQGTRYSKTGNASLDPHWALFALQRSTRVTLQKETERVNETAADTHRPTLMMRDKRMNFVSFNDLGYYLNLTCSFVFLPRTDHFVCDGCIFYVGIVASALFISNDRDLDLLQCIRGWQWICGREYEITRHTVCPWPLFARF